MSTSEDQIVKWFADRSDLSNVDFPIGIGDDMAEIRLDLSGSVLVTTDILADGVHFDLGKATLEKIGYKAIAVSLSDCAAMATVPVGAVVSVLLPSGFADKELKELHNGILKSARQFHCELMGGDIARWPDQGRFVINVAMISRPTGGKPLTRSGAQVGDCICVTGSLGGSDSGKHLNFKPRVKEAIQITRMVNVNAMIDISDGLSTDLNRICIQSGVGAILEARHIPISPAAKQKPKPLDSALNDGEDFELLFTLAKEDCRSLLDKWRQKPGITKIGEIVAGTKMQIRFENGKLRQLKPAGYDHLK